MKNFCILASVILMGMVSELVFFHIPILSIVIITATVIFFLAITVLALEWASRR